ncbi:SRPBCC domain-containing protein [Pedobacter gandavensis]|uniref:SRPBCC domain-containing protein n=1 Tax=Pedobacter gandavensis TaxID=2679963 RepID=UPI00292DA20C|nr:SRPBCC domain-containing protein [Pedobacter gandavensis]
MSNHNFTTTILVEQTPAEAFEAITNVRGWWSQEIEGGTERLNDEFTYHYQDIHRCKMKLIEVVPEERVVWKVLENYFNFTEDAKEWTGNKISFEISIKDNQTEIKFTHWGLAPSYECYQICFESWTHYIQDSLYSLITTGKGQPNLKENK